MEPFNIRTDLSKRFLFSEQWKNLSRRDYISALAMYYSCSETFLRSLPPDTFDALQDMSGTVKDMSCNARNLVYRAHFRLANLALHFVRSHAHRHIFRNLVRDSLNRLMGSFSAPFVSISLDWPAFTAYHILVSHFEDTHCERKIRYTALSLLEGCLLSSSLFDLSEDQMAYYCLYIAISIRASESEPLANSIASGQTPLLFQNFFKHQFSRSVGNYVTRILMARREVDEMFFKFKIQRSTASRQLKNKSGYEYFLRSTIYRPPALFAGSSTLSGGSTLTPQNDYVLRFKTGLQNLETLYAGGDPLAILSDGYATDEEDEILKILSYSQVSEGGDERRTRRGRLHLLVNRGAA